MIHGERVKQAREFGGWTQGEFGQRLGLTQAIVAHVEAGRVSADGLLEKLVFSTGFPPAFFNKPLSANLPMGSLLFRAHAALDSSTRGRLHREAELAHELVTEMLPMVNGVRVQIPRLIGSDADEAARVANLQLGIARDVPIPNLTNRLEKAGAIIVPVPVDSRHFDGFSLWAGDQEPRLPVIVSNSERTTDRWRWNLAHELGHLVMHSTLKGGLREIEQQANAFAGEFLLPAAAMTTELPAPLSIPVLADLKRRWRVSMQAIIRRARDLEKISETRYYYWLKHIGRRGQRDVESVQLDGPPERPRLIRKVAEVLYGVPVAVDKMSAAHALPSRFLTKILAAHADAPVPKTAAPPKMRLIR